jgi:hypothetical protein
MEIQGLMELLEVLVYQVEWAQLEPLVLEAILDLLDFLEVLANQDLMDRLVTLAILVNLAKVDLDNLDKRELQVLQVFLEDPVPMVSLEILEDPALQDPGVKMDCLALMEGRVVLEPLDNQAPWERQELLDHLDSTDSVEKDQWDNREQQEIQVFLDKTADQDPQVWQELQDPLEDSARPVEMGCQVSKVNQDSLGRMDVLEVQVPLEGRVLLELVELMDSLALLDHRVQLVILGQWDLKAFLVELELLAQQETALEEIRAILVFRALVAHVAHLDLQVRAATMTSVSSTMAAVSSCVWPPSSPTIAPAMTATPCSNIKRVIGTCHSVQVQGQASMGQAWR